MMVDSTRLSLPIPKCSLQPSLLYPGNPVPVILQVQPHSSALEMPGDTLKILGRDRNLHRHIQMILMLADVCKHSFLHQC